jgi:ATP phosphoribosyltransferase regulatory subunit HisZ
MEEAARQISEAMNQQKMAIETALQAVHTIGGDRALEETFRIRLRDVVKKLHRKGDETRTCLRAIALERQTKVEAARAEHKAEEARANELKLLVDLRKAEADVAKYKSKDAALAAKAALESAKKEKDKS